MPVKRQDGFTLVELLVAMVIGMITIMAAFTALDSFGAVNTKITARSDNTQRARLELDGLVRALRSQVCLGAGSPGLLAGTSTSITFVTDLGDGTVAPQKRTVTYNAPGRRLTEARYAGSSTGGVLTFSGTAAGGPQLANVEPDPGTGLIFGYFAYDTSTPPRPILALPVPLSDADRSRVARITVGFRVGPAVGQVNRAGGATLEDEVLLRSVDPADPIPLPRCS